MARPLHVDANHHPADAAQRYATHLIDSRRASHANHSACIACSASRVRDHHRASSFAGPLRRVTGTRHDPQCEHKHPHYTTTKITRHQWLLITSHRATLITCGWPHACAVLPIKHQLLHPISEAFFDKQDAFIGSKIPLHSFLQEKEHQIEIQSQSQRVVREQCQITVSC